MSSFQGRRTSRAMWFVVSMAVPACAGTEEGAGSSNDDAELRPTACASTVEAANGRSCSGRATCGYPVTCGAFEQHAECDCVDGRFACSDAVGLLPVGTAPRCVESVAVGDSTCGSTMGRTEGQPCERVGELCFFEGFVCPGRFGVSNLDFCSCEPDEDRKMHFACTVVPCGPAPVDGGDLLATTPP